MSGWETIETTVVQTLAGLTLSGSPLLATAKGQSAADRKTLAAAIGRERLPAGYVVTTGRDAGEKVTRRSGAPTLSVLLATRSLRRDDDVRRGASDVTGVFTLSEEVASALQDLAVGTDRLLVLVDERPAGGDEGMALWEQRYEVRCQSETQAPTFGGTVLAGVDSEVHVELGTLSLATSLFSFPGIDGVFERHLGVRERPIRWTGQLRAASDSALNAVEADIEDEVYSGKSATMVDAWGRSHEACVVRSFERKGRRRRDELTGEALQDFEITFVQLGG
jgi:hypothetical protein